MADWYPDALDALIAWHNNFSTQAAINGTTLGLTAAQVTQIAVDKTNVSLVITALEEAATYGQSLTAFKNELFSNTPNVPLPAAPDPPGKLTLPAGSLASIEARTRQYANIIKASPAYSTDDGEHYGIIPAAPAPPGTPGLVATAQPGSSVKLRISKAGYAVLAIDSKRGGGVFEQIGVSQTAEFIDTRAPLIPNTPEQREYRAQGMQGNARVGTLSDVVVAVTIP